VRFPAFIKSGLTQGSLLDILERDGIIPNLRYVGTETVCSGAAEPLGSGYCTRPRIGKTVRVQVNAHLCTGRSTSELPTNRELLHSWIARTKQIKTCHLSTESLGFVKTLSVSTDKYLLNERRELYKTVEIELDRLEHFGFRRFENRPSTN
jgi:hypothetical protein